MVARAEPGFLRCVTVLARAAEAIGEAGEGVEGVLYLLAATFGNVHGAYKPGGVKLRPEVLKKAQDVVGATFGLRGQAVRPGLPRWIWLVPGRSARRVSYGVVKMNIDTDTQYAFTRPVAGHMFDNYDGVLKIDGEVGNKKAYDPRSYLKAGEAGMAARVVEACQDLRRPAQSIGSPDPRVRA